MARTVVVSLENPDQWRVFSLPAREAVFAAYRQAIGDWATWDYEAKLAVSPGPVRTGRGWTYGGFWAREEV